MPRTTARRAPSIVRTFLTPRRFRPAVSGRDRVVVGDGTTTLVTTKPDVATAVGFVLEAPPLPVRRRPRTLEHPPVHSGDAPRAERARAAWARKVARDLLDPAISTASALALLVAEPLPAFDRTVEAASWSPQTTSLPELVERAVGRVAAVTLRHGDGSVEQLRTADTWAKILGARAAASVGPSSVIGGAR
ncbi:hypothetical protein ACFWE5_07315 [Cellulosimicrobium funkei]|uniref:hypothetical protein n=1 Tax=Cellulosimicrobium funkei TaxID=264251 RepID=UPI00365EF020